MSKAELLKAFDELEFGADCILNVRDSFPTAEEARRRVDPWLRQAQVSGAKKVLVITGRGKGSADGFGVVKQTVEAVLHKLRREGVVNIWSEHTEGAFSVEMASIASLLSAPRRSRRKETRDERKVSPVVGLDSDTEGLLRRLAERSLHDLGIKEFEGLVEEEMATKLSILLSSLPSEERHEQTLRAAIIRALEELD
jgi:hypothetical protein